jgi:hypothetical protein
LIHVSILSKYLASQILGEEPNEMEIIGCEAGTLGMVVRNLPALCGPENRMCFHQNPLQRQYCEAVEIELRSNNRNREDGFVMSRSLKYMVHFLK